GEDGMPHLARFYERVSDPKLVPALTAIAERFGKLGLDSTDRDVSELIESFMTTFAPLIEDFAASDPPIDLGGAADIFFDYATDLLNAQQRAALERLAARLNAL